MQQIVDPGQIGPPGVSVAADADVAASDTAAAIVVAAKVSDTGIVTGAAAPSALPDIEGLHFQ